MPPTGLDCVTTIEHCDKDLKVVEKSTDANSISGSIRSFGSYVMVVFNVLDAGPFEPHTLQLTMKVHFAGSTTMVSADAVKHT